MSEKMVDILVPVDFSGESKKALPVAQYLAKVYEGQITLVHILELPSGIAKLFSNVDEDGARREVMERLDAIIEEQPKGINYRKVIKVGRASAKIIEVASELDANCIVMGTNGASGVQELISGSNVSRVIKHAPCPVISLKSPLEEVMFNKILLPIDLSRETGEKLKLGVEFAQKFNAELVLLTILEQGDQDSKNRLNKRLIMALEAIRKHKVPVESTTLINKGDISNLVIDYAQECGADLIAIMTQQELAFKETLFGSNASHVVNHSNIPVLSIRPEKEYKETKFESAIFS